MQDFDNIEDKLKNIQVEYNRIVDLLTYEEVLLDKKLFLHLSKEKNRLEDIATTFDRYLSLTNTKKDIEDMLVIATASDKPDFEKELSRVLDDISKVKEKLVKLYMTLDAEIQRIQIEISADKSDMSTILLKDLIKGYTLYAESSGLRVASSSSNTLTISGLNAYEYFEGEKATHIAVKDKSQGVCRVFVYDNIGDILDFSLDDVEIVATRSSGAGGQHINTTDSAIRATHIPTKISVYAQEERSQIQNKEKALSRLREKVTEHYASIYRAQCDASRKEQLRNMKDNDTKVYDYNEMVIRDKFDRVISLKDFLQGKAL